MNQAFSWEEIDKTQLALAHLLVYMYHNEKEATRRMMGTRVFAKAACAVSSVLENVDKDMYEEMKLPSENAEDYVLAAMQSMVVAWDRIRELESKKIEGWSVVPTADRKGVAIKCLHHAKDKEVCVAYRDGTLQVNVWKDGEDAPLVRVNQGESK